MDIHNLDDAKEKIKSLTKLVKNVKKALDKERYDHVRTKEIKRETEADRDGYYNQILDYFEVV